MAKVAEQDGQRRGDQWRIGVWGAAAFILLLPLVAMQFTDEVNWDLGDFVIIGAMLATACGTYELAARMTSNRAYRGAVGIAVVASFLLIWINMAVGIIGEEDNELNLLYGGVLAVGLLGALIGRFQPAGMARAFAAAAVAQIVVGLVALSAGYFTLVLDAFFAGLWLISAALFAKAARDQAARNSAAP